MTRFFNWLCGRHLMDDDNTSIIWYKLNSKYGDYE